MYLYLPRAYSMSRRNVWIYHSQKSVSGFPEFFICCLGFQVFLPVFLWTMEFAILILKSVPFVMNSLKGIIASELFNSWMESAHFLFIIAGKAHKAINLFYALWLFPLALLYYRWTEKRRSLLFLQQLF
jgi:hypothetical protein